MVEAPKTVVSLRSVNKLQVVVTTLTDPGHGQQQGHVAMLGAEPAQLTFAVADLAIEVVDSFDGRSGKEGVRYTEIGCRRTMNGQEYAHTLDQSHFPRALVHTSLPRARV